MTTGWVDAVRQVVAAVRDSDVTQLELAGNDFLIRLRREPLAGPPTGEAADDDTADLHKVVAPFTGIFYRSPTPAARPFVNEGDWVDAEVVIGLVETMKIFNEVTADISGRIVAFKAESDQLVHAGDVLALMAAGERSTAESELPL